MAVESPIVLIHGAFQTAATWDLVAPRLEAAGRRVIVAPLMGLDHQQCAMDILPGATRKTFRKLAAEGRRLSANAAQACTSRVRRDKRTQRRSG